MSRIVLICLLVLLSGLALGPDSVAQETGAAAAQSAAAQPGGEPPAMSAGTATQSPVGALPQRTPAERTMRGYWHLFIAFAVTWLLLFGYVISLGRRFGSLERQLERSRGG